MQKPKIWCGRAQNALSDLGFAEFFFDGSRNWRVFPSRLGGTAKEGIYFFTGARSPDLLDILTSEATSRRNRGQSRA